MWLEWQTQFYGFPQWCVPAFQAWNSLGLISLFSFCQSLSFSLISESPYTPITNFGCVSFVNFIFSVKDTVLWKFLSIHWQMAAKCFGRGDTFVDSLLCVPVLDESVVKHYRIRRLDEGGFFLTRRKTFSTLNEFVSYYTTTSDGLCVKLGKPCLKVKLF